MGKVVTVRLPESLIERLDAFSKNRSKTIAEALRRFMDLPATETILEEPKPVKKEAPPIAAVAPSRDAHASGCNCMLCQIRAKRGRG